MKNFDTTIPDLLQNNLPQVTQVDFDNSLSSFSDLEVINTSNYELVNQVKETFRKQIFYKRAIKSSIVYGKK